MDLGFGGVAYRRLRDRQGHIDVAGHLQVEHLTFVRGGSAEGCDDDRGRDWFRGCEELVGQVLVRLKSLMLLIAIEVILHTKATFALPLSFTLSTKDSSSPVVGSVRVRNAWCGRFAVLPSRVVRSSFSESVASSDTDLPKGVEGLSLVDKN